MSEEKKEKFDKRKYDIEFKKTHYKKFAVDLDNNYYSDLCKLLKEKNLTKVQFVKNAYEELKKK